MTRSILQFWKRFLPAVWKVEQENKGKQGVRQEVWHGQVKGGVLSVALEAETGG